MVGRKFLLFHDLSKLAVNAVFWLYGFIGSDAVRWVLGSRCVLGLDTMGMGIGIGDTWCV